MQNELYKIMHSEQTNEIPQFRIRLEPEHFIFKAHFPGRPIMPGVCIIQIAKELLEIHMKRGLKTCQIKNVKFLSVISPTDTPEVTYSLLAITQQRDEKQIKAQISVTDADTQYAKISMICE